MSRSSAYLAGKKSRHGTQTEKKRARTAYILEKHKGILSVEMARLVALQLKSLVVEEVAWELDRRGYQNREDSGSTTEMPAQEDQPPSQEVDGAVEEA